MSSQLISDCLRRAVSETGARDVYADRTFSQIRSMAASLGEFMKRHGATRLHQVTGELTVAWCLSPVRGPDGTTKDPSDGVVRFRQWTARKLYTVAAGLGAQLDPDLASGDPIPAAGPDTPARLLTDEQLQQVCDHVGAAPPRSREPLLVALMLAGGSADEIPGVRARDVDVGAGTVRFVGGNPRLCALDAWSVAAIARYLHTHPGIRPDDRLCVEADTPHDRAAMSVTNRLCRVLRQAGLASRAGLSARSIRLTAARRVLERDGIAAATRFLGARSLDNTAAAIGHAWQHPRDPETAIAADNPMGSDDAAESGAAGARTAGAKR